MSADSPTSSSTTPSRYPHVVVRLMPAVYQRVRLVFGCEGRATSNGIYVPDVLPRTGETGDVFDDDERAAIVRTIQSIVDVGAFRMCIVFGATDCVFIERNAPPASSNTPPSGGVQFLPLHTPTPTPPTNTGPVTRADFVPTGVAVLASPGGAGPTHRIGVAKDAVVIGADDTARSEHAGDTSGPSSSATTTTTATTTSTTTTTEN
jgi:hypothetical protein